MVIYYVGFIFTIMLDYLVAFSEKSEFLARKLKKCFDYKLCLRASLYKAPSLIRSPGVPYE